VRYRAAAVVCLAVGFGAGWLTFDWPFGGSAASPGDCTASNVEAAVTAHATGDVRFTKCDKLASPPNVWDGPAYIARVKSQHVV
jgi:hypothetical protein